MARVVPFIEDAAQDAHYREQAEDLFKMLFAWVKRNIDQFKPGRIKPVPFNGGFIISTKWFTDKTPGLFIELIPAINSGVKGAFGKGERGVSKMQLAVLRGPGDATFLVDRLMSARPVFIHEFTHYMDVLRTNGRQAGSKKRLQSGGYTHYANTPTEFNAFYQEGAGELDRIIRSMIRMAHQTPSTAAILGKKLEIMFRSLKDFDEFAASGGTFDRDWYRALDPKNRKRFLKRLSGLYRSLKRELGDDIRNLKDLKEEHMARVVPLSEAQRVNSYNGVSIGDTVLVPPLGPGSPWRAIVRAIFKGMHGAVYHVQPERGGKVRATETVIILTETLNEAGAIQTIRDAGRQTSPLVRRQGAGTKGSTVNFRYTRKLDGKTSSYNAEPYEFRKNVFWAYHGKHNSIHSFIWPRVKKSSVNIANQKFSPRWPIKLDRTPRNAPVNRALVREALELGLNARQLVDHLLHQKLEEAGVHSWWISSQGRKLDVPGTHNASILNNDRLFKLTPANIAAAGNSADEAAIKKGWVKLRTVLGTVLTVTLENVKVIPSRVASTIIEILLSNRRIESVQLNGLDGGFGDSDRTAEFIAAHDR